jgi:hypothetical protein
MGAVGAGGRLGWRPERARRPARLGAAHELPGRDYVAVAEALVTAGNELDPGLLEVAEGPLYAWLRDRLH